ncbi:MAG: alpha/beta fold hydrolase, partial [Selenomonadaceae bacterium]|nr:alpha/beta fold hydrolase [Selenomonadaceae bacterium]
FDETRTPVSLGTDDGLVTAIRGLNGGIDGLDNAIVYDVTTATINGSPINISNSQVDVPVIDGSISTILGLDAGAKLQVSAADTYKVNGTEITAGASSVIVGTADGNASLYTLPAALADFMLHKTEAGYPAMAALAFHPDEADPEPPTNYHSAEKWTTNSIDDLQLSAIHYSPENPTGKWVILVHGYGKKGAAMNALAEPYLAQGIDVLIVDQRAAGDSEGDWLTMGVAEANDLAIWTQEIAKTNANAQITLHGVSMGAATVMLCAALPETTNVSAMIEDCGYGNIADVFKALMYAYGSALGVSGVDLDELFDEVAAVAKTLDGGYDVADAAPIESIAAVTVPSLFIHGAADVVIPSTNADALYEASGASNKTKLIIEGAGHAKSIVIDTEAYLAAVKKLIDSSTTEIGALIDSDADSKVLRGTIYNDTITNSGHSVTIEALGGDDYIVNNVDSTVTAAEFGNLIELGDGNDTVYNHHSYNPTIYGGAGDDSIVISRGHKTFADGGDGNDSIIGRLADNPDSDWAIGGHATVLGGDGDDYISTGYTNDSTIDG